MREARGTARLLAAGLIVASVAGVVGAGAAPANVTVTRMWPVDGGVLKVARVAGQTAGASETWRMRADFTLTNNSSSALLLSQVLVEYSGAGAPTGLNLHPLLPGYTSYIDSNGDGSDELPATIPSNGSYTHSVHDGFHRTLPLPLPAGIKVTFVVTQPVLGAPGETTTIPVSLGLSAQTNLVPLGGYFFPAKASDLPAGHYWSAGIHANNPGQRFGYDFGVSRWDPTAAGGAGRWTALKPGAAAVNVLDENGVVYCKNVESGKLGVNPFTNPGDCEWQDTNGNNKIDPGEYTIARAFPNADWLIFGTPVYAMADGVVVYCVADAKENLPGISGSKGGNYFWIRHSNGEYALYAHLKEGSVQFDACKSPKLWNVGTTVSAGQMLGRVGNTGSSGGPHLHLHLQADHPNVPADGEWAGNDDGRPLNFHSIQVRGASSWESMPGPPVAWNALGKPAATLANYSLINPNPCGFFPPPVKGAVESARHGIPSACYQDAFNAHVWSGYRPNWVDGYEVGSNTYFNAVFRENTGTQWSAAHGMTGAAYQSKFDEMKAAGFRLYQIDSYVEAGQVRYAAIFLFQQGPPVAAYHGLTDAQHQAQFDSLTASGYRPVNISPVSVGGVRTFAALYEQIYVGSFYVRSAVPEADFQTEFDAQKAAGRAPVYASAHVHNGTRYLGAIWYENVTDTTVMRHGMTSGAYDAEYDTWAAQSFYARAVAGYESGGSHRFVAIWRPRPNTTLLAGPASKTSQTTATFLFKASVPGARFLCRLDAPIGQDCASPAVYNSLAAGTHLFYVTAVDREGLHDLSWATHSWLIDVTPPSVTLLRPRNGSHYVFDTEVATGGANTLVVGPVKVQASALDAESGLASVRFLVDGVQVDPALVSYDAAAQVYWFMWQTTAGFHVITARATNNAGLSREAAVRVLGVPAGAM